MAILNNDDELHEINQQLLLMRKCLINVENNNKESFSELKLEVKMLNDKFSLMLRVLREIRDKI